MAVADLLPDCRLPPGADLLCRAPSSPGPSFADAADAIVVVPACLIGAMLLGLVIVLIADLVLGRYYGPRYDPFPNEAKFEARSR